MHALVPFAGVVEAHESPEEQIAFLNRALAIVVNKDVEADLVRVGVRSIIDRSPLNALEFVSQLSDDQASEVEQFAIKAAANTDQPKVNAYLQELWDGQDRDRAMNATKFAIKEWAKVDPEQTADWIMAIDYSGDDDLNIRKSMLRTVMTKWSSHDPEGMVKWFSSHDLAIHNYMMQFDRYKDAVDQFLQ